MKSFLRRFSIYGDFWLRYLHWGARHCPWFLEPMFIAALTVAFWFVLGKQRNAVAKNLAMLLPGSSPLVNQLRVLRVFWNFSWTIVDMAQVRLGRDCIGWEVCGTEHLDQLEKGETGAILMTAHMGNYDVAAPLFAKKIQRPIHLVRAPERHRESQEFEKDKRDRQVTGNFVIHYNEPGNMLGVTLAQAIAAGGIVAVQGDRILFDVSPMTVPFKEGVEWQVPRGPFTLALVAKVAIHPVFIIRMGWRRYRVQAEPAIELPLQDRDRERVQFDAAVRWSAVVRRIAERHWRQWFVLEDIFTEGGGRKAEGGRGTVDASEGQPDLVIPPKPGRGVRTMFLWNALAGGWTSAVVLRRLLEWAVGDAWRVVGAIAVWPVVWLLTMVLVVHAALGTTALVNKLLRLSDKIYDALACGLTLLIFGVVAWSELRGGCPVGCWLGVIGFAGIGAGLLQELISRMARQ